MIITSLSVYCLLTMPTLKGDSILKWINKVCLTFFTIEFVLRVIVCPRKLQFIKDYKNWIDFLSIIPSYLTIAFPKNKWMYNLVIIRLLRVFKFFKLSYGLQVLLHTLKASSYELTLLLLILLIPLVVFSSLVYAFEYTGTSGQTDFDSIPRTFWWTIVTMTTVGYGDMAPKTWIGQVIGSLCAIISVLIIALPISVIGNNFNLYYAHVRARLKLPKKNRHLLQGRLRGLLRQPAMLSSRDRDRKNVTRRNGNSLHISSSPNTMHGVGGGKSLTVMHAQTAPIHHQQNYNRRRDRSGAFSNSEMSLGSTASTSSVSTTNTQQKTTSNDLKTDKQNTPLLVLNNPRRQANSNTAKPRINPTIAEKVSTVSIPSEMFDDMSQNKLTMTKPGDSNSSIINSVDTVDDVPPSYNNTISPAEFAGNDDVTDRCNSVATSKLLRDDDYVTSAGDDDISTFDDNDVTKRVVEVEDIAELMDNDSNEQMLRPVGGARRANKRQQQKQQQQQQLQQQQEQRQRKQTANLTNRNPCSVFFANDDNADDGEKTGNEVVLNHVCESEGDQDTKYYLENESSKKNNNNNNDITKNNNNTDNNVNTAEDNNNLSNTAGDTKSNQRGRQCIQSNTSTDGDGSSGGGGSGKLEKDYINSHVAQNTPQMKHNSSGRDIGNNRRNIGNNRRNIGNNRRNIGNNSTNIGNNRRDIGNNRENKLYAYREESEEEYDEEDDEFFDSSGSSGSLVLPSISLSQKELKDHYESYNKFSSSNNIKNNIKSTNQENERISFLTTNFPGTEESALRRQSMKKMTTVDFDTKQSRMRALSCEEQQGPPVAANSLSSSPFKEIFRKISSPPLFFGYNSKNNVIQYDEETQLNNNSKRSLKRSATAHNFYRSTDMTGNNVLPKQSLSIADIKSLRESGV